MAVIREVLLQLCDEWVQLTISHRVGGRLQVIPAEEAPSLGSAVALDDGYLLVWRVCGYEKQQCLELEELHNEIDAASGRIRVFFDEQIVDVKCLARDGYVVLMIFTLTAVHFAQVELSQDPTLLQELFPVASAVGLQRGGADRSSENASGRTCLSCSWSKLPAWSQVHEAKEGQSVLCCDTRFAEKSDEIDVYLGTNGGVTLVLSISDQGKVTTKSELRQTSGGFSLFRSPAKTLAGGQRVTCIVVDGEDKLLTLSEDGKVKRWNTRTSKCLAERSITVDEDLGTGRVSTLCAFKMCVMPEERTVIFALRADDAHGANRLVQCEMEKIADLNIKDSILDNLLLVVEESLQMLGESGQVVELKAMGPAIIGEDDQRQEVLVSGWQGLSASVTVVTRMDVQVTERIFSQCADLQSQVELAALYLDKWRAGSGAEGAPEPLQLIQEIMFRPHRFSSAVLHSSMQQLVAKYRGQAPQMRTWPGPLEAEHKMHEFIRRTIDDIAESTRVPAVDVWHTLLALCEHHWRSDCDGLLGVIGVELNISSCLLVKQRGTSVLRLGTSSERDFHRLMLDAETDNDDECLSLDGPEGCLLLSYKALVWMESDDPGGAIFSQLMMSQDAELVVDNMLHELMVSSCEPPVGLDPEQVLRDHPQLLVHHDWNTSNSSLCQSFDEHLAALAMVAAPQGTATGQESTWMKLYKQEVCEQLVKTHYEIVRGLSLALALVDYHHKATGDDELDDESYERVRSKLRGTVLPLLSSYHVLRWSAGRTLPACKDVVHGGTISQLSFNVHTTLLSLCVKNADPADLQTVVDFVKDPVFFICNPVSEGGGEEGLIWKTFKVLRRENVEDDLLAAHWKDLLGLCKHPTTTRSGSKDSSDMISNSTALSSWWFHTVVVPFVRGYSCMHVSNWKEANKHFSTVLHGSRRLIAGCDVSSARALLSPHPLMMLQEELACDRHQPTQTSDFSDYQSRRGQLRNSMRTLTMATKWGPSINNLLDYFLLLHDYLGSKGLIQSIRELILARIQLMRPARAGLVAQQIGINVNADGGVEGAIDSFCALMHLAMDSLSDLKARLDGIEQQYHDEGYQDAECVFAIDCFRYLIAASQHYLRISWLSMYTDYGMFDEAFDLVAESIAVCNDDDISKMREVLQEGGDEYRDVERWLDNYSSMDVDTYNSQPKAGCLEWAVSRKSIDDKLHLRSRKEAYRCLEVFVSALGLQVRPDKLCSYPWINCSHTVDTLLRERCEHLQETTSNNENLQDSYNVRYAFNIARSDYRTAGDTMMTYCFNLVTANMQGGVGGGSMGVPESGERLVDLNVLKQQAYFCLAAINCYSLIDERFAFWVLPQTAALAPKKRQASIRDGIDIEIESVAGNLMRAPEVITLPMMLQHYALLRARIRLAERYSLGDLVSQGKMQQHDRMAHYRMVSFSVSQQQGMAEDTVEEMLKVGLLDDAISLAAAFCTSSSSCSPTSAPGSLAIEDLCRALTERCLKSMGPNSPVFMDEDGPPTLIDEDGLPADEAWEFLVRFLMHFDGSAKPASLVQQLPHKECDSSLSLDSKCPKPFGRLTRVAAESFLRSCPDPESSLPPWLVHTMRAGTQGGTALGFDAKGGDTSGLLRLLLRYNRLEEASQLVSQCLTLESDGTPVVPRKMGSVKTLPTLEECLIMDLSATRYVPYNLIDQLLCRLKDNGSSTGNNYGVCIESVERSLHDWMRFTEVESEMVSAICCCPQVNACVNEVLAQRGINPVSGEKEAMTSGGEIDIQTLVHSVMSKVQTVTPIGKAFARLKTGRGHAVNTADQDKVLERLCLQMLHRTRPRMCPHGECWQEAWEESKRCAPGFR